MSDRLQGMILHNPFFRQSSCQAFYIFHGHPQKVQGNLPVYPLYPYNPKALPLKADNQRPQGP